MRLSSSAALFLASAALILSSSCSADPDEAREELRLSGIEATQGSFNKSILEGDAEAVDLILKAGVRSRRGLMLAAKEGQCDILRQLLKVDDRVDGILAAEALAWALFNNHDECVENLEAAGADLHAYSRDGENALTQAAEEGDIAYLKVLISVGMDPDEPNRNGKTALIRAVESQEPQSVRELVRSGADVNAADLDGWTPLTYAAWHGRNKLVRLLLDLGAGIDLSTRTGWTPLALAALEGRRRALRTLLGAGADPDAASEAGLTPLMRAAQRGDRRMARALLQAGADRDLRIDGVDAAWWAATLGHEELEALLSVVSRSGTGSS